MANKLPLLIPGKLDQTSAVFAVSEHPVMLTAWGLPPGGTITFQRVEEIGAYDQSGAQCFGLVGTTDQVFIQPFILSTGCVPQLTSGNNMLFIAQPGWYRAVADVTAIGQTYLVAEENRMGIALRMDQLGGCIDPCCGGGGGMVAVDATMTEKGIVELADLDESVAGIASTLAMTPAGVAAYVADQVPLADTLLAGKVELADATEMVALTAVDRAISPGALGTWLSNNDININGLEAGRGGSAQFSNTAFGNNALRDNTTGTNQVAFGSNALQNNVAGSQNTAFGALALSNSVSGSQNVAVGYGALFANGTGASNVAVGPTAMASNTTGNNNTAVGSGALSNITTGSGNVGVGKDALAAAATSANEFTLGGSGIATLRCNVTSITAISDARDKTEVRNIEAGLAFVNALRPVSYTWNMRDGSKVGLRDAGFLAQDVRAVQGDLTHLGLVYEANPDRLELTQGRLIPILVKAIQELAAEVAALKAAK